MTSDRSSTKKPDAIINEIMAHLSPPKGTKQNPSIPIMPAFLSAYRGSIPSGSIIKSLSELETHTKKAVKKKFDTDIGSGAIANVRGTWLEYIIGLNLIKALQDSGRDNVWLIRLPNATHLEFHKLFKSDAQSYLQDLFRTLQEKGLKLTMSNPDFICVADLPSEVANALNRKIEQADEDTLSWLETAYQNLIGQCDPVTTLFALTVKTSIRPDRRIQIIQEANIVKTFVAHLAGRYWEKELYMAFYAMVAGRVGAGDKETFKNPATHSLVQVSWEPVPLVDEVLSIDDAEEMKKHFLTWVDINLKRAQALRSKRETAINSDVIKVAADDDEDEIEDE